jgi:hypothetical protein
MEVFSKAEMLKRAKLNLKKPRAQMTTLSEALSARRAQFEASTRAGRTLLAAVRREQRRAKNAANALGQAQQSIDRMVLALLERKNVRAAMEREAGLSASARAYPTLTQGALLDWPLRGPIVGGERVRLPLRNPGERRRQRSAGLP